MNILDDLKTRGVRDIIFLCSDNLPGMDKSIEAIYPDSIRQICIVHQIRNTMKYVSYKDRRAVVKDVKGIYQSSNEQLAKEAFDEFKAKCVGAPFSIEKVMALSGIKDVRYLENLKMNRVF